MAKVKITEEEVASVTSILFKHWGYDLYYETQLDCFGGRPDIVGVKGKSWCSVIECKASLSYPVLEQVIRWHMERDYLATNEWYKKNPDPSRKAVPHFLWVATGNSHAGKIHDMKRYLLDKFRIGWIDITVREEIPESWDIEDHYLGTRIPDNAVERYSSEDYGSVRIGRRIYEYRVRCEAKIQDGSRKSAHYIVERLLPEMKEATAGVTADKANYVTPFKLTLRRVVDNMEKGKWYKPADLLDLVEANGGHHYSKDSTFKSSIGGWLLHFNHCEANTEYNKSFRLLEKEN